VNDQTRDDGIDVRTIVVGRQPLRVATSRASSERPPLLLFNGIGANWKAVYSCTDQYRNHHL
jgi:hypothetical protein